MIQDDHMFEIYPLETAEYIVKHHCLKGSYLANAVVAASYHNIRPLDEKTMVKKTKEGRKEEGLRKKSWRDMFLRVSNTIQRAMAKIPMDYLQQLNQRLTMAFKKRSKTLPSMQQVSV
jgi:hypothetical protein